MYGRSLFLIVGLCSAALAQEAPPDEITGVARLKQQAAALRPLFTQAVAREFLDRVPELPPVVTRTIYRDADSDAWVTADVARGWTEARRTAARELVVDEDRYYNTFYGSPLVYGRVLDVLGEVGVRSLDGRRVLDFGYGSVGHLRLMAGCGAEVVGTEVSSALRSMYSQPQDQGPVRSPGGRPGRVTLVHGRWPGAVAARQQAGGPFDIITSKNTLKNGYINPEREVEPRKLVDLGVPQAEFVRGLFDALVPGGLVLIYNLCPAMAAADEPYVPWADGRSPFSKGQWKAAGFEVLKFNENDDRTARRIFEALGLPTTKEDGTPDLFALYTLVRRPTGPEARTVEAGCATCIFDMQGVRGCKLAVRIDGKPYLVSGSDIDDHGDAHAPTGLCLTARTAVVRGSINGDVFAAETFVLQDQQ